MIRNMFTVDVEEYFCVSAFEKAISRDTWNSFPARVDRNVDIILDLLERYQAKGTFFVLGWLAKRNPGLVRRIAARGHEVASHGYDHQRIHGMSRPRFTEDVRAGKAVLEGILGKEVCGYRAPSFSVTKKTFWALDVIAEQGFLYDSSIFPVYRKSYGIPDAPRNVHQMQMSNGNTLWEVPLPCFGDSRWRLPVGGGAYLRWYPYMFTEWALKRINVADGIPFVFYIHPWELDIQHPNVNGIDWVTRQRHYHGIPGNREKLANLLRNFRFSGIRDVIQVER